MGIFVFFLFTSPPLLSQSSVSCHSKTIYFYSSETNINNFSSLKVEFDTYLSNFGSYEFQPFSNQETFEKFMRTTKEGIFFISSWHFKNLQIQYPLRPILVGQDNNQSTQKVVLSTRKSIGRLENLKGKKIAAAGSREYTKNLLRQMFGQDNMDLINSVKIFTVPKDIDALMAVGFGMANAALTTENSLTKLAKINPKQHSLLTNLAISKESLLPVVAVRGNSGEESEELLALLQEMGTNPDGEKRLKMLGLDLLKQISEADFRVLNR